MAEEDSSELHRVKVRDFARLRRGDVYEMTEGIIMIRSLSHTHTHTLSLSLSLSLSLRSTGELVVIGKADNRQDGGENGFSIGFVMRS
jgi:hypothetical protein